MPLPLESPTALYQEPAGSRETALSCLVRLGAQSGINIEIEALRCETERHGDVLTVSALIKLADQFELQAQWRQIDWQDVKTAGPTQPLLIFWGNSDAVIVTGDGRAGAEEVSIWDPRHDGVIFYMPREDFERSWDGHALVIIPKERKETFASQPQQEGETGIVSGTREGAPVIPEIIAKKKLQQEPVTVTIDSTDNYLLPQAHSPKPLLITASVAILCIAILTITWRIHVGTEGATIDNAGRETSTSLQSAAAAGETAMEKSIASISEFATKKADSVTATLAPIKAQDSPASDGVRPPIGSEAHTDSNAARPQVGVSAPARPLMQATDEAGSTASPEADPAGGSAVPLFPATSKSPATTSSGEPQFGDNGAAATSVTAPLQEFHAAELTELLARGDVFFSKGDLLSARLFYERAADAGNGQAALRLGETFDPVFLDQARLPGARGDGSMALSWYRRARDLGIAEAEILLKSIEAK
jgi:Peptidase C39 family